MFLFKAFRRQFNRTIFFPIFKFSHPSSIHFLLHLSLARQKVNEMKKWRITPWTKSSPFICVFVGERRRILRVSSKVCHTLSSRNLNATMIQHIMPLFDAPLFVSKSCKPQNRLVFPPGTAKYDNLSCVHTLATRCVLYADRCHFFILNFNFFAGILYITLFQN
jgi:hypothetical protein